MSSTANNLWSLVVPQQQGPADDTDGRSCHCSTGNPGRQAKPSGWEEHPCSNRYADDVVPERPDVVHSYAEEGFSGQVDGGDHILQVALHEDNVGSFDGDICSCADCQPHVSRDKCWGVVDSIANHCHGSSRQLQEFGPEIT